MRKPPTLILIGSAAIAVALSMHAVHACSCINSDDTRVAYQEADVVMSAEILLVEPATSAWGRAGLWIRRLWAAAAGQGEAVQAIDARQTSVQRAFDLRVVESFKGAFRPEERLYSPADSCAPELKVGQQYVVYAYYLRDPGSRPDRYLVTSLCSKTGPLAEREAEVRLLRELRDRKQ